MKKSNTAYVWGLFGVICLSVTGCSDAPSAPTLVGPGGSWYATGFRWPHDGRPFRSEHFVIYSDGASDEARAYLAQLGEELLTGLKEQFGVSEDLLRFPAGQDKIHVFAYKNRFPQQWGGWAYYGGLLIYSQDHKERSDFGHTAPAMYAAVVKHELMHVVESLVKASGNPELVDVWLTEGIAEMVSGGTAGDRVTSRAVLAELVDTYGARNPIAMHQYRYPSIEGIAYNYYYPMFELAVTYLFDPDGHGQSPEAFRDLLLAVRDGTPFARAFEDRLGISLASYEANFFDLMDAYLN